MMHELKRLHEVSKLGGSTDESQAIQATVRCAAIVIACNSRRFTFPGNLERRADQCSGKTVRDWMGMQAGLSMGRRGMRCGKAPGECLSVGDLLSIRLGV